jgi:LEA14-like dessication related protein
MVRASLAVCALLAAAPNCPDLYSLGTHGFTVPTVDATSALAVPLPGGILVTVQFTADNPNPFPIALSSVDYAVTLDGQPLFAGSQADPEVPEHGKATLGLMGAIETANPAYRSLRPGETVAYRITGTAHVNSPAGVPVDVEFDGVGTFVVPQGLPAP